MKILSALKWMKASLTAAVPPRSKPPETDHSDWVHLRPETRAARLRLAKLFYWCASSDDKDLTDDDTVEAAIRRYRQFSGRPLIDPNE